MLKTLIENLIIDESPIKSFYIHYFCCKNKNATHKHLFKKCGGLINLELSPLSLVIWRLGPLMVVLFREA